jgi:uncharacterized protein YbjT (DUF2867 family)
MTMTKVLVTGALGNVGAAAVASLTAAGIPVRAADLFGDRLDERFPGLDRIVLDFEDPATFGPALDGCDGLFLLRPPPISKVGPTLNALVDEGTRRGLEYVVFSSVAGADTNKIVPHHRVETHLQAGPIPWTILRPGFFAQNMGDAYRVDIVDDDRIFVPAGEGKVAFVDVRDLGDVAAVVFGDPSAHAGRGYTMTGPEAVTFDRVAAMLTDEMGRVIRYEPASLLGYSGHLRSRGLPLVQVVVQVILHRGLRHGDAEAVEPDVVDLLGRPARTVEAYIHDHRELWARP